MQTAYLQVVVMLHTAFAGVFLFLNLQAPRRHLRFLALSWAIEAVRASILLSEVRALGGSQEFWFGFSDTLCFFANWFLFAGFADLLRIKLPKWLGRLYIGAGVLLVLFNRFWLDDVFPSWAGVAPERVGFIGITINLALMFVSAGIARLVVVAWLLKLWKQHRLPGALIAGAFGVPYALFALLVPFQHYFQIMPDWFSVVWCMRVLGFSIGLVIVLLNLQQMAVAQSEADLAAAQRLARFGSWQLDVARRVATWSAEMFRLHDRNPALGVPEYHAFLETMHPEDVARFQRNEAEAIRERRSCDHEFRVVRRDGRIQWIQAHMTPEFDDAGRLWKMAGVQHDITARKHAESRMALQHAVTRVLAEAASPEETMRRVLQRIADGLEAKFAAFWTYDRSTQALRCAEMWFDPQAVSEEFVAESKVLSLRSGIGLPGRLLQERRPAFVGSFDTRDAERYPRRRAAGRSGLKGGSGFPILLKNEIFGVVELFSTDSRAPEPEILELFAALGTQLGQFFDRQRLEEQYRQSQKMEAVGTLAGGIAHDFNNILTAINGYSELALFEAEGNAELQGHLRAVQEGARRAVDLVRQIMAFSRQQEQRRVPIAIAPVVSEAIKLLRATIPATIEIKTDFAPDLPLVLADSTSVHQVVVNLGTNANHAMKNRPGRLEIAVEAVVVDEDFVTTHPGLKAASYVRLSVSDTGVGMSPATQARIFEPFFTTKGPGEGTGLGLAVVHGIMQSHEGAVFVYSHVGKGTTFTLYFPAHQGLKLVPAPGAVTAIPTGSGQRILYVEDEESIGRMAARALEKLGYRVEVHASPTAALEAFRANPSAFDLVITDLSMPLMSGLELSHQLLQLRPQLPILLTTGYAATLTAEQVRAHGIRELILKPHTISVLGASIRAALADLPPPTGDSSPA